MTRHDIFSTLAILGTGAALAGCATMQADTAEVGEPQGAAHGEGSCSAAGCGKKAKAPAVAPEVAAADAGTVEAPTVSDVEADANAGTIASDEQISADAAPAAVTEAVAAAEETPSADQAEVAEEVAPLPPKKTVTKTRRAKKKKRSSAGEADCGEGTCA